MKKVLALVLASVLALGMTTVAFANDVMPMAAGDEIVTFPDPETGHGKKGTYVLWMDDISSEDAAWGTDDDGDVVAPELTNVVNNVGTIEPGNTLYFPITVNEFVLDSGANPGKNTILSTNQVKLSALDDFRISYSIDDGKNMIESVKFVVAKNGTNSNKGLYLAIKTRDNFILEDQDVDMKIRVNAKDGSFVALDTTPNDKTDSYSALPINKATPDMNVRFTAQYETVEDLENGYYTAVANVLTFDTDANDVILCYNDDKSDVEVSGNMIGQKKVFVRMSTSNTSIEDRYPDATLRLFDGDKDTFKREVTVKMPYATSVNNPYLYELDAKGNLVKLYGGDKANKEAGATKVEYDDVKGAFIFKTNTLGNYLMSDVELKASSTVTDTPTTPGNNGNETNPGTGASDFVGLAVALAVVSVAGIAVAKRK